MAAGPRPAHILLIVAALSAYLCSVPAIEWLRTRRPEYRAPALLFGTSTAAVALLLVVSYPALVPIIGLAAACSVFATWLSLGGHATSVAVSLVQVVQAIALVPAAAVISGAGAEPAVVRATLAAGIYLVGSVLVVRSLIRGRGNASYMAASVAFHVAGLAIAAIALSWPYAVVAAALLARAIALPVAQARLEGSARRIRPIHIGVVEIVASLTLVAVALAVGF